MRLIIDGTIYYEVGYEWYHPKDTIIFHIMLELGIGVGKLMLSRLWSLWMTSGVSVQAISFPWVSRVWFWGSKGLQMCGHCDPVAGCKRRYHTYPWCSLLLIDFRRVFVWVGGRCWTFAWVKMQHPRGRNKILICFQAIFKPLHHSFASLPCFWAIVIPKIDLPKLMISAKNSSSGLRQLDPVHGGLLE